MSVGYVLTMQITLLIVAMYSFFSQHTYDTHMESIKVLVTSFKDEKETCKKNYFVNSAKDLIDQSLAQQTGCVLDRLLKYNTDFMVYMDVDTNVDVKDFDRFHVFLSARGPQMETCYGEANGNQVHFVLLQFPKMTKMCFKLLTINQN